MCPDDWIQVINIKRSYAISTKLLTSSLYQLIKTDL